MSLNLEQLQKIWDLHKELDNILESFQFSHKDIKSALNEVYVFLKKEIKISAFFVETKNEKLINTVFNYGNCTEEIKLRAPLLEDVDHIVCFSIADMVWFAQPIDVDSHIIGTIAIGFQKSEITQESDFYSEALNTVSELLDSFFYGIHSSSIKHSLIMGLQDALADLDINSSLKRAAMLLYRSIKFEHMLVVYTDRDLIADSRNIKYIYFNHNKQINDNNENPLIVLDNIIREKKNFLAIKPEELKEALELKNVNISYLNKGIYEDDSIGFICVESNEDGLSLLAQELIQIFTEELRQRLVDLNREKNILRKYFPNMVITKLITTPNYEQRYLKAKDAEIGIIFADLSGFTKMSEQILKTPERITNFINKWAKGVVSRIFPLGATLDKIIGDCAMFLFGPPFYTDDKETVVRHMLQASQQIVKYTKNFLESKQNQDIKAHPDYHNFGVSIGVNFCHCTVGLIGPNQDLTAFSSGVNITARLQGIAKANEILVTERVKEIATSSSSDWHFSEKQSTKVKNVSEPLGYYSLISGRQE